MRAAPGTAAAVQAGQRWENKYLYRRLRASGPLSLDPIPLGVAKVVREGRDVSLITYSAGVSQGLEVAEELDTANKRKAGIVNQLYRGLSGLLKRREVTVVEGFGSLTPDGAVSVDGQTLRGRATIICTGSVPRAIPGLDVDGVRVVTSDQSTNDPASRLPERVAVIGGGVIGAEFASVYTDLGVNTTLLEALPHGVLPIGPDRDCADVLARSLKKRGTTIHAEARVGTLEHTDHGVVVPFESPKGSEKIEVDRVLVSIGRRPLTEGMGFEAAGVRVDQRGFVEVDPNTMLTSRPGVYAIGDCVNTPGLAHVAYAEAVLVVDHFLGENPVPVDYGGVPWVVYTHPEVAWSGMTEAEARAAEHDIVVHKHAFAGNGRAMILGETDGLVKVVAQRDGPILGFHLVGPWASELLHEGYLALNWEALPSEVGRLIHAHPSLSEAIGETMITFSGRSLHG